MSSTAAGQAGAYYERVVETAGAQGPIFGVLAEPGHRDRDHSAPARPNGRAPGQTSQSAAAVLIVAGQPQTRVGSHRMFTDLARLLAAEGVATLRFDVGGWGDSPGEALPFEASDRDIAAAAALLSAQGPTDGGAERKVWILGLCDGASAAVLALPRLRSAACEPAALVLVNPWVRSEASLSDAMVRNYYAKRLFQRKFWGRLLSGKVSFANLVREPLKHLGTRISGGRARDVGTAASSTHVAPPGPPSPDLPSLLLAQLDGYAGRVLTVLSGNDLTAAETESLMSRDRRWRRRLERKGEILRVPGADHTFSEPAQWATVARWVAERVRER